MFIEETYQSGFENGVIITCQRILDFIDLKSTDKMYIEDIRTFVRKQQDKYKR